MARVDGRFMFCRSGALNTFAAFRTARGVWVCEGARPAVVGVIVLVARILMQYFNLFPPCRFSARQIV